MKSTPGVSCRCCLSEECYKDMRNEYYFKGQKEVYYETLKNTFQIIIEDSFMICEKCIVQLRNASAFKRQVLQAEQAILGRLPKKLSSNQKEINDDFLDHITGDYEEESDESDGGDRWCSDGDEQKDDDTKLLMIKVNAEYNKINNEEKYQENNETHDNDNAENNAKDQIMKSAEFLNETNLTEFLNETAADVSNFSEDLFLSDYNVDKNVKRNTSTKAKHIKNKQESKQKENPILNQSQTDMKENSLKLIENSNLLPFISSKIKFRCFFCKEVYYKITELRQHTLKHEKDKKALLSICIRRLRGSSFKSVDISSLCCNLCNSKLENLTDLQTHLTKLHGIEFSNNKHFLVPYKLEDGFQCVLCQEEFNNFFKLSTHMNSHYSNNVCEICGLSYINRMSLRNHVHAVHKEQNCSKCPATFPNNYARYKHMKKVHNSKSIRYCLQCNKTFPYTYMLLEHKIQEHGVERKISVCGECGKTFLSPANLRVHTRAVHVRERRHPCGTCGMGFFTSTDRKRHEATHQEYRSFACNYCEGRFKSKDSLRRHLRRQHDRVLDGRQVLEA